MRRKERVKVVTVRLARSWLPEMSFILRVGISNHVYRSQQDGYKYAYVEQTIREPRVTCPVVSSLGMP